MRPCTPYKYICRWQIQDTLQNLPFWLSYGKCFLNNYSVKTLCACVYMYYVEWSHVINIDYVHLLL